MALPLDKSPEQHEEDEDDGLVEEAQQESQQPYAQELQLGAQQELHTFPSQANVADPPCASPMLPLLDPLLGFCPPVALEFDDDEDEMTPLHCSHLLYRVCSTSSCLYSLSSTV